MIPPRSRRQRLIDYAFALAVISLAASGLARDLSTSGSVGPVRSLLIGLHLLAATLFAVRHAPAGNATRRQLAAALPGLVAGSAVFALAPSPDAWPVVAWVAVALGGLIAVVGLLTLGRNFSLLPARRELVTCGPYRLVRHPVYLGESLVVMVVPLAQPRVWWAWLAFALVLLLIGIRILAEEAVLRADPGWSAFAARTRWRLLPLVW